MQKKPLSHAQMALVFVAALALSAPVLYLTFAMRSPLPGLVALALSQGFLVWKKRRSAAN